MFTHKPSGPGTIRRKFPNLCAETTAEEASTAADAILEHSVSLQTKAYYLSSLRKVLRECGCPDDVVAATKRPGISVEANRLIFEAAAAKRRVVVPAWLTERGAGVVARIRAKAAELRSGAEFSKHTGRMRSSVDLDSEDINTAADTFLDLCIALSARLNEMNTLRLEMVTENEYRNVLREWGGDAAVSAVMGAEEPPSEERPAKRRKVAESGEAAPLLTHVVVRGGVLKKRGGQESLPLVSCCTTPEELADLMTVWEAWRRYIAIPPVRRSREIVTKARERIREHGVKFREVRAIGAGEAVRARHDAGASDIAVLVTRAGALRHAHQRPSATAYYSSPLVM